MSITLGIVSWQEGNSGWVATLNADLNRLASAVDSVSSGNISSGSILPLALNSDNSVTLGGILAVDSTTGHFYVKPSGVDFSDLPGQSGFTGGEIVRAKSDLSGLEPIPDNSIDFEKIDYAGSAGSIKIIMHNGTKPELYTQIPTGNLPQIPVENLPIYTGGGTPLTGYVIKAYVSGGQITYLYPDITANSEETNRIKWTSALTDSPLYGDEFVAQKLPNLANIGKAQESSGGPFLYPPEMSFVGKILNSSGTLVTPTSAEYIGQIRKTSSGQLLDPDAYFSSYPFSASQINYPHPLTFGTETNVGDMLDNLQLWKRITAFNATPPTTSTITMTQDLTASVKVGSPILYKVSGTYYRGKISALTSNLMTIRGVALSTSASSLQELYYSTDAARMISLSFPRRGLFAKTATTSFFATMMGFYGGYKFRQFFDLYLVEIEIIAKNYDTTASTQPTLNFYRNGNAVLSSAISIPNATSAYSGVNIVAAQQKFSYGDLLEATLVLATGGTPSHNSADLCIAFTFVRG